jgi:hypothetical protein
MLRLSLEDLGQQSLPRMALDLTRTSRYHFRQSYHSLKARACASQCPNFAGVPLAPYE